MTNNKMKLVAAIILSGSLLMGTSASALAFKDVKGQDAKITESLQKRGVIQGMTKDKFVPQGKITGAQGINMIVQALGLKENEKSKTKHFGSHLGYKDALQIAEDNGIKLPKNFDPNAELSREAFVYLLMQGVDSISEYATVRMIVVLADADQVSSEYANSIQMLLLTQIGALDNKDKFYPKQSITRIDAARLVYNAAEFAKEHKKSEHGNQEEVSFSVERVNDRINKVVLTRYNQPNPGYGISVAKIEFTDQGKAIIYYKLLSPKPNQSYIQVISDTKTETYISSGYQVEIALQK
ncbi:S-layer homology domain-containing protein [Paenibacillus segetis]|uniref:SLH domain-containing protein n=1 Tax=Paenibacillus segetis TaxID=1325360 RepID=A0ABQ1YB99_9BACL|nr:S-layer homology domain-containing protein [Paenibacillus segetis]GGH18236.1 hypothetical protein GCM10008013_14070 [Paenibacillus segetis]